MNSINQNQGGDHQADLLGGAAVAKIRELVKSAQTCFFCTNGSKGESAGTRPMNVREVDDAGNLWFLCASDSHTRAELAADPQVKLYFQGSPHSNFLLLAGVATLSNDAGIIRKLWEPILKTWFTEGVDDPRITVVHFTPENGYYWDNKHGDLVAGAKILIGATIGKTLDDSIEGTLNV